MSATVTTDLPCLSCGYNLRTQSLTGVCPECTHPVAASLAGDQLGRADPRWLAHIQRGLLLDSIASLLIISYVLCQMLDLSQIRAVNVALAILLALFALTLFIASLHLAAPEPARPRRLLRFTLLTGTFIFSATMLIQSGLDLSSEFRSSPQIGQWEMLWNEYMGWLAIAMPIRFAAEAILLTMLARRCRANHLHWQSILLGWLFTASTALATIGPCIVDHLTPGKAPSRLESAIDFDEFVCIALYVWVVALLALFYLRIRRERTPDGGRN